MSILFSFRYHGAGLIHKYAAAENRHVDDLLNCPGKRLYPVAFQHDRIDFRMCPEKFCADTERVFFSHDQLAMTRSRLPGFGALNTSGNYKRKGLYFLSTKMDSNKKKR
jgi:hypothetical protein